MMALRFQMTTGRSIYHNYYSATFINSFLFFQLIPNRCICFRYSFIVRNYTSICIALCTKHFQHYVIIFVFQFDVLYFIFQFGERTGDVYQVGLGSLNLGHCFQRSIPMSLIRKRDGTYQLCRAIIIIRLSLLETTGLMIFESKSFHSAYVDSPHLV
ncbi:hypothetical protein DFJ43DRAFT_1087070 [Lentinula guzmanii]|uniref:Uncharacterized protein n=1 Tax=Lentinula guzmanii TaxID=2804957 RepID=A0AA38J685_9AGAR|nr:hypothetical protein DFJ43DRAFT_1087070 [Lentinula guzmanii]